MPLSCLNRRLTSILLIGTAIKKRQSYTLALIVRLGAEATAVKGADMNNNMHDLKQDLTKEHWKYNFNWTGLSIDKIAKRYNCSMDDVRRIMAAIEREHPKPRRRSKNDKCETCRAPIVWIGEHPCDPPIFKGVDATEKVHTVRQSHLASCPQADRHRKEKTEV